MSNQIELLAPANYPSYKEDIIGDREEVFELTEIDAASPQALDRTNSYTYMDPEQIQKLRFTPEQREQLYRDRLQEEYNCLAKAEIAREVGLGVDVDPPDLAGLGSLCEAPFKVWKAVKKGFVALSIGDDVGVRENARNAFANVLGFVAGGCSGTTLAGKAIHYFLPALKIPAVLVTVGLCGTIFGFVVATIAGATQMIKLYRQVTFCNSPCMRLAKFLEENPPESIKHDPATFMLRLYHKIQYVDLQNLDFVEDRDKLFLKHFTEKLGERATAIERGEPELLEYGAMALNFYRQAAIVLAKGFEEEYKDNVIELQRRVGVSHATEVHFHRFDTLALEAGGSQLDLRGAEVPTDKALKAAVQITQTFKELRDQANRKKLIHVVGIVIAIVAIVSLGLSFASGIGLAVPVGLFIGICILNVIHSRISKNFDTKIFSESSPDLSKQVKEVADYEDYENFEDAVEMDPLLDRWAHSV